MASFTAVYTALGNIVNAATLSSGATRTDAVTMTDFFWAEAQVILQSSASAAGDVTVDVLGSSDAGSTYSTDPVQTFKITFAGAQTKSRSIRLLGPARAIKVTNGTGQTVTYTLKAAGQKALST